MQRIMVATDLEHQHEALFGVALRMAQLGRGKLRVVHAHRSEAETDWRKLPSVRTLLTRWGAIEEGAGVEAFDALGLRVMPIATTHGEDPVAELVARAHDDETELLVMGSAGRVGVERLLQPSVAETVARRWGGATLVVPEKAAPLVADDGTVRIRKVLVPIDVATPPQALVQALTAMLEQLHLGPVQFVLLHVGGVEGIPSFDLPERPDWMWRSEIVPGDVVESILHMAQVEGADLIAMATHGHDSWLDALRGSHTERVLRRAPCAVLSVPVP